MLEKSLAPGPKPGLLKETVRWIHVLLLSNTSVETEKRD
jgi:hypothetical protein